jgi:hypothetical protein
MPSESDEERETETKNSPSSISISDNYEIFIEILKRFFYQILGIYIPAFILILYFVITWNAAIIKPYWDTLIQFFSNYKNYEILLLFLGTVILGESINAFTAWITRISPVKLSWKEKFKLIFKNSPLHIWLEDTSWPIWINITSFPVSFAVFDRYYLTTLDQEKKILAGKIGWTAFYRNLAFVFSVIVIISLIPNITGIIQAESIYHYLCSKDKSKDILSNLTTFLCIFVPILPRVVIFLFPIAAIPAFYMGYRAQLNANKNIFWNAYRRNELRKVLESRYGDLPLSLGVLDKYRKKARDYIEDRWFFAVDSTVMDLSRYLLGEAEMYYKDLKIEGLVCNSYRFLGIAWVLKNSSIVALLKIIFETKLQSRILQERVYKHVLRNKKEKIKKILVDAYKEWDSSNYEIVISHSILALRELNELRDSKNELLNETYWKKIKGHYHFAFRLRTDAAFEEIKRRLLDWEWTIRKKVEPKNYEEGSTSNAVENKRYDQSANLVWEYADYVYQSINKIKYIIEKIDECRETSQSFREKEKEYSNDLENIFILFGGYDYKEASTRADCLIRKLVSQIKPT